MAVVMTASDSSRAWPCSFKPAEALRYPMAVTAPAKTSAIPTHATTMRVATDQWPT